MAVSIFSLMTGFYDLYRHMPFLDQVRLRNRGLSQRASAKLLL